MSLLKVSHSKAALSLAASALVLPASLGAQTVINQAAIEEYFNSSIGGYVINDGNEYLIGIEPDNLTPLSFGTESSGDNLIIGYDTTGSKLTIDGREVVNYDAYVGQSSSSSGTVEVAGDDGKWNNYGTLYVGSGIESSGSLIVRDNANVTSVNGVIIGNLSTSTGTLSVSGTSTTLNSKMVIVGNDGTGGMTVGNGATITVTEYSIVGGGSFAQGTGTATLTGSGTSWTSGSYMNVGYYGTGTLTIEEGASVSNTSALVGNGNRSKNGNGTVNVRGSDSSWVNSGALTVGGYYGTGTLNIESGATVSSVGGKIGDSSGARGTVIVSGAGSSWENDSFLWMGLGGTGTLKIEDGALVTATTVTVGSSSSSCAIYLNGGYFALSSSDATTDLALLNALLNGGASVYAWNGTSYVLITSSESPLVSCQYYSDITTYDALAAYGLSGAYTVLTSTYAVPEPATYALLGGLGALGLAVYRRRR